jgi:hypothetical protein
MAIKLNKDAVDYAIERIRVGEIDALHAPWSEHQATDDEKDKFLETHDTDEYGLWFLGENDEESSGGKEKYFYPTGDLKLIHLTALEETEQHAHRNGYQDIAQAAQKLLKLAREHVRLALLK